MALRSSSQSLQLLSKWRTQFLKIHHHHPGLRRCCSSGTGTADGVSLPLRLTNTFTKKQQEVILSDGSSIRLSPSSSSSCTERQVCKVYSCGPTVYDDCHLGHAFCYIRLDLIRRSLQTYANTDMITCMGVTDIDDKILNRVKQVCHAGRKQEDDGPSDEWISLSRRYFDSFRADMKRLNILPPHAYLKVSEHIDAIMGFIKDLESSGSAYVNEETLDVVFNSAAVHRRHEGDTSDGQVHDPYRLAHHDADKNLGKRSPSDFVLWKKRKPGEPYFEYESVTKQSIIEGRPGWHVQCSAMIKSAFPTGQIDVHYGGSDLVFPHHYNESACCTAHSDHSSSSLDPGERITDWCPHWIHSGHLIMDKEKMSKSVGNMISIKDFLSLHSHNLIRIACIRLPIKADVHFDQELLNMTTGIDVKLKRLFFIIDDAILRGSSSKNQDVLMHGRQLEDLMTGTENAILAGIADNLNFNAGLQAVISLYNHMKEEECPRYPLVTLIRVRMMLNRWLSATGLTYGSREKETSTTDTATVDPAADVVSLVNELNTARHEVRRIGLELLASKDDRGKDLLKITDQIRDKLDQHGLMPRDPPSK